MPNATTLQLGQSFLFVNNSSGVLTITNNASAVIETIPSGGVTTIGATNISTSAGTFGIYSFLPGSYDFNSTTATFNGAAISSAVWNGTTIATGYGGTGLTTYTSGGAVYANSSSTLTSGTLPITAGGTGATTAAGAQTNLNVPSTTGSGATGTWGISITGSASGSAGSVANAVTFNSGGSGDASGTSFNGAAARTISYNTIGAPSTSGTNASGTWSINVTGSAGSASSATTSTYVTSQDIRTLSPSSTTAARMAFGFTSWANNNTAPWADYLAMRSYTDASGGNDNLLVLNKSTIAMRVYQQAYGSSTAYSSYADVLMSNNYNSYAPTLTGTGATGTWAINISGNAATATAATTAVTLTSTQSNWNSTGVISNVVGMLAWKNYGNSHVIFDASASTSPSGTSVNNTNSQVAWTGSYPTLMGWNGASTYGVRVDSARISDSTSGSAGSVDFANLTNKTGGTGTYTTSGDYRAPIFYDSNNTGYYVDPNGTSNLVSTAVPQRYVNRNATAQSGINWYINSFTAWTEYMSPPGTTGCGPTGNITAPSGTIVTSWALRSFIENVTAYGWTFESGGATGQPTVVAEIRASDGMAQFNGGVRAPIFYDSNDTGYYGDFASTSSLNTLLMSGPIGRTTSVAGWFQGTYNNVGDNSTKSNPIYTIGSSYNPADTSLSNMYGVGYSHPNFFSSGRGSGWAVYTAAAGSFTGVFGAEGNGLNTWIYGYGLATGSWRAPIFYDSDDTGYYDDPNGTGNISSLNIRGTLRLFSSEALQIVAPNQARQRADSRDESSASRTHWYGLLTDGNTSNFRHAWYDGSAYFNVTAASGEISFNRVGGGGYVASNESLRAPIFYDLNDSGYYVNPNGGSYLSSLILSGAAYFRPNNWIQMDSSYGIYWPNHYGAHLYPNGGSTYTQLQIDGSKNGYSGMYASQSAVNIGMYDSAGNGGVYREANGRWYFYYLLANDCMGIGTSSTSSTYSLYLNKGVYAQSRIDATIYYDTNNTAYYVDPNGTSEINKTYYNANQVARNYGLGSVGIYSSYRYQGVFSMGESYLLPADGTTTGSLYGIAWSHPNAGGVAGNLNTHGALFLENGGYLAAISGSIRCRDDMRTPIYYDSNDTGYYLNPNSVSYLSNVQATEWFRPIGGCGVYWNSYGRGIRAADNEYSYGNIGTYSDGLNGWRGYGVWPNNFILMFNGSYGGFYNPQYGWLLNIDTVGNVTFANNVSAYSDLRLKNNIREIDNVIERRDTLALAAIKYERNGQTRIGYGAQTLRDNGCAEFVREADDALKLTTGLGTLSVDYGETAAILAVASKLTDDRVAALEVQVQQLLEIINELRNS